MSKDKTKIVEKLINIVLDLAIFIFGIILLISIYNNIQIKVLKNSYSSFFGYSIFGVQTGSMADAINAGDWIIVKNANTIKIDDVVTYEEDGEFITHRVVEAYQDTFVTMGDANNTKDDPITKDQIVGKVVKILPNFEILKKTLFNPIVLIALIGTLYLTSVLFKKKDNKVDLSKHIGTLKEYINKSKEKTKEKKEIKKTKYQNKEKVKKEFIKVKMVAPKKEEIEEEIVEKLTEEVVPNIGESEYISESDLDKTMCFRVISVDKSEIEGANIEPYVEEEIIKPIVEEKEEDVKEEEVKKTLELLQHKKKRFENIIEKVMFIKEQELLIIVNLLINEKRYKPNYPTIKERFLEGYIDGKYYNYCGDVNVEYNSKNMNLLMESAIESISNELINSYKGNDKNYKEKVIKFKNIFNVLNDLEEYYDKCKNISEKREKYTKKISKLLSEYDLSEKELKDIIDKIIKTQRVYRSTIKYSIDKLDTNMFNLNFNNTTIKDTYAVELVHNIAFSKIYSDYIVDKTYTEGIIAEDKIAVLMTLLSMQLIKNMLSKNFKDKYIIYIPNSLYSKDSKLDGMFDMINDEHAKNSVITLLKYDELIKNKSDLKRLTKLGYRFAVDINDVTNFKLSDQVCLELVDYIFLSDKNPNKDSILLFIPKVLHSKVFYDEIDTKVGSYVG